MRPERPPFDTSDALALWLLGILLPAITIGLEVTLHMCSDIGLFDPIPTWWHVALISLVPCTNFLVWLATKQEWTRRLRPLAHLNAFSIGVSAVYAAMFFPITPFAVIGIVFVLGWLALAPAFSLIFSLKARGALRRHTAGRVAFPSMWPGFLAGIAVLAIPEAHHIATRQMLATAVSKDPAQSKRGVALLRTVGSHEGLLRECYEVPEWWDLILALSGHPSRFSQSNLFREQAQTVYYRVTGESFNAVPAPAAASLGGRGRGTWNFDSAQGGTRVADKIPGLSMKSSRLDGKVQAASGTSYLEWTMVFTNIARNQSEARAQIELPPGAVVSRLTLWINGEPREAAFGGRSQVRAAYQEVAVQQRRDPVLVTTAGPDRVLMQCFPVPPDGGEMKVRMGITVPLRLLSEKQGSVMLPHFLETNFEQSSGFTHQVWMEGDQPLNGSTGAVKQQLSEQALRGMPAFTVPLPNSGEVWTEDPTDPAFAIRQTVRKMAVHVPSRVAFVIDGSKSMAPRLSEIGDALKGLPADVESMVVFASDDPEAFEGPGDRAAAWLRSRTARGGCDNLPALERAWDFAAAKPGGAVVWLYGPQPVVIGDIEALLQRTEREHTPPLLYHLPSESVPNRILEKLDRFQGLRPVRFEAGQARNLTHLLALWRGEATEREFVRERVARPEAPTELTGDRHIARLWGAEEVARLIATPATASAAAKLAVQLQLVTSVSGAVVLERKEQYERHDLTEADLATVPTIPEPGTALLAILGGGVLLMRRRRPSAS